MNRKEYLDGCAKYLSRLVSEIRAFNALGHFDINKVCEDFFLLVLQKGYHCPNLKNLNQIAYNFPAVDLGDETTRVSFQVTSDSGSTKIIETLNKFTTHNLDKKFDVLYVLILTEKQSSYTSQKLKTAIANLNIKFEISDHIVDMMDVIKTISALDTAEIQAIYSYLEQEFEKKDRHLHFRENLEDFLEFGRSKIEIEKNSKKYIPSIFMETHAAKEEMRLFAHPLFFYRKVDDRLAGITNTALNKALTMASQPMIVSRLPNALNLTEPSNLDELRLRLIHQEGVIEEDKAQVIPMSYYAKEHGEAYAVDPAHAPIWSIVRLYVQGNSSGVVRSCDKALHLIGLMKKKIFLVTGMAGQGKTNFICDIIENQFAAFEIPSVFVPARELNAYPAPNRIFGFLTNNRYAPKITTLHDLLSLFDKIAKERGRPFIIAIDGINEVSALEEFNSELKIFLAAVCQYDYVKVIITCRSEFFDSKFSSILNEEFRENIHRIADLKSKMSDASKGRMLKSYLKHFEIRGSLLPKAANFLKNDLLLIRIFCELNEKTDIGRVTDIYKGDLFEKYLIKKFSEFPEQSRQKVLPTLYKLVAGMVAANNYTTISLNGMSPEETEIVQTLVSGDVVLRQEVPENSLSTYGQIVVSFTYDELRDFVIAHYLVQSQGSSGISPLEDVLTLLKGQPPYEGVFKYLYILARRQNKIDVVRICEKAPDFLYNFALNLSLLPPDLQSPSDLACVKELLANLKSGKTLRAAAVYLYHRRDKSELLNIGVLLDHLNSLENDDHQLFIKTLFSYDHDYGRKDWSDRIADLLENIIDQTPGELSAFLDEVLAFYLHAACFAEWIQREQFISHIFQVHSERSIRGLLNIIANAKSSHMKYIADELTGMVAAS